MRRGKQAFRQAFCDHFTHLANRLFGIFFFAGVGGKRSRSGSSSSCRGFFFTATATFHCYFSGSWFSSRYILFYILLNDAAAFGRSLNIFQVYATFLCYFTGQRRCLYAAVILAFVGSCSGGS